MLTIHLRSFSLWSFFGLVIAGLLTMILIFFIAKGTILNEGTYVAQGVYSSDEDIPSIVSSRKEYPAPSISVKCYPNVLYVGDTLYIHVTANNPHEKDIYLCGCYPTGAYGKWGFRFSIEEMKLPLLSEAWRYSEVQYMPIFNDKLDPGSSKVICVVKYKVPPLERLRHPDFIDWLKTVPDEGAKVTLQVQLHSDVMDAPLSDENFTPDEFSQTVHYPLTIKKRNTKETALIDSWYKSTKYFPEEYSDDTGPYQKVTTIPFELRDHSYKYWERYPGDRNAPKTWQGWKRLEDNLIPSTMRDEIRLTRILIQYSATKQASVLKELKEWFTDMNEIQRTVMAKSLRDRAANTYDTKLLPQFREVYKAIHEYDVVPMLEREKKHLQNLVGLIE